MKKRSSFYKIGFICALFSLLIIFEVGRCYAYEWSKTFGGIYSDYARSVQQTSDGGYIIAGNTDSFGAGGTDIYLIKTGYYGNESWSRTFGGDDEDFGYYVQQTSDGGYIIAGTTYSFGAGKSDIYLIKTIDLDTLKVGGGGDDDGG